MLLHRGRHSGDTTGLATLMKRLADVCPHVDKSERAIVWALRDEPVGENRAGRSRACSGKSPRSLLTSNGLWERSCRRKQAQPALGAGGGRFRAPGRHAAAAEGG